MKLKMIPFLVLASAMIMNAPSAKAQNEALPLVFNTVMNPSDSSLMTYVFTGDGRILQTFPGAMTTAQQEALRPSLESYLLLMDEKTESERRAEFEAQAKSRQSDSPLGKYIYSADGKPVATFVEGPYGDPVVAWLKDAEEEKPAPEEPAAASAPKDSTAKSYKLEVNQSGDPTLVSGLGAGTQQGGGQASGSGKMPEDCFTLPNGTTVCKEKVNGVETRTAYYPDGSMSKLDNNTDMAILGANGKDFITSSQKAEIGPRNANKFGMRDASGTDGDKGLGKHGGVWTGQGGTKVLVGNGGGCCESFRLNGWHSRSCAHYGHGNHGSNHHQGHTSRFQITSKCN